MIYALKERRTGRYLTGTDFRYYPPHQILNGSYPKLFSPIEILTEIKHRGINLKYYKVVCVTVQEIQECTDIKEEN